MSKIGKDKTISIRLSQTMLEALDTRAIADEKDRTQVIEDRVDLLEESMDKLREQVQITEERTDLLEMHFNELNSLMAVLMGRYKK
jgi:metal-responsive CopG/Arc/MetJ family transcriptional regulator